MSIYENDLKEIYKIYCESNMVKGGLADGMTLTDIAEKHGVDAKIAEKELMRGINVEMEHTTSAEVAKEIALDHLFEDIYYYQKLAKIEKH
jgi:hypothetical protein